MTKEKQVFRDARELLEHERKREVELAAHPIPTQRQRARLALEAIVALPLRSTRASKNYRYIASHCVTCARLAVDFVDDEQIDAALLTVTEGFRMLTTGLERIARDRDLEEIREEIKAAKQETASEDAARIRAAIDTLRRSSPRPLKSTSAALEALSSAMKRDPRLLRNVLPGSVAAPSAAALKQRLRRAVAKKSKLR